MGSVRLPDGFVDAEFVSVCSQREGGGGPEITRNLAYRLTRDRESKMVRINIPAAAAQRFCGTDLSGEVHRGKLGNEPIALALSGLCFGDIDEHQVWLLTEGQTAKLEQILEGKQ